MKQAKNRDERILQSLASADPGPTFGEIRPEEIQAFMLEKYDPGLTIGEIKRKLPPDDRHDEKIRRSLCRLEREEKIWSRYDPATRPVGKRYSLTPTRQIFLNDELHNLLIPWLERFLLNLPREMGAEERLHTTLRLLESWTGLLEDPRIAESYVRWLIANGVPDTPMPDYYDPKGNAHWFGEGKPWEICSPE